MRTETETSRRRRRAARDAKERRLDAFLDATIALRAEFAPIPRYGRPVTYQSDTSNES